MQSLYRHPNLQTLRLRNCRPKGLPEARALLNLVRKNEGLTCVVVDQSQYDAPIWMEIKSLLEARQGEGVEMETWKTTDDE